MPTRTMTALFSGAALMNAAMSVASTVATLVAADRWGMAWGGAPATAGVIGTGVGALVLGRAGWAPAFRAGYAAAAVGAGLAALAVAHGPVSALLPGMALLGLGNAAAQLSRYAAAETVGPDRRGRAIGAVVWAGAFGAVGGPLLLAPTQQLAGAAGWPDRLGPFLLVGLVVVGALVAATRLPSRPAAPADVGPTGLRILLRRPVVRTALAVMATGQVVMVAVMTAAPVDMRMHGHSMTVVGATISAHTFGMFGLAPITGWILDRIGPRRVMQAGLVALLVSTAIAVLAAPAQTFGRPVGLFVLGYAWNLCFVGGSGALAQALDPAERGRAEGAVDAVVWVLASVASLASTALLAVAGYRGLAMIAGLLVLVPAVLLAATVERRRMVSVP